MACSPGNTSLYYLGNLHSVVHVIGDELSVGGDTSSDYVTFYRSAQFITGLLLYPLICIVGVTGSIFTLVVFNQKMLVTSTSVFLSALAVADLIRLLNDTLYFIVSVLMRTTPASGNRMMGYMYPFSHYILNQSVCVASWLHVCIGCERYIHVCKATKVKEWCSIRRARLISAGVFISMSLVTIPSAMRYEGISVSTADANKSVYAITLSQLGQNERFMTVYIWTVNLLRSVIPLCLLIILNARIIHSLRKQHIRSKISGSNRITVMLIVVIVVFVVCITPDAIMSTGFGYGYIDSTCLIKGIRECTDTLLAVNSAVNFPIYCLCSHTFRRTYKLVFCPRQAAAEFNIFELRKDSRRSLLNEYKRPSEVFHHVPASLRRQPPAQHC
jgi:hypothetical protein